ncbi:MAG: sulfatase-like hydrolase/transferase [bacterium]
MLNSRSRFVSNEALFFLLATATMLLFASLWRLIFLVRQSALIGDIPWGVLAQAFTVGWRFDFVIVAYTLLPLYILSILPWLEISRRTFMRRIILGILFVVTGLVHLVHLADLEFFAFFNQRLNGMALSWQDSPGMMASLVWDSYPVIRYLLLWVIMLAAFIWVVTRLSHYKLSGRAISPFWVNLIWAPLVLAVLFLGGRGRLADMSPIRTGVAYFSEYQFANQLALSPAFTFWRDAVYDARNRKQQADFIAGIDCPDSESITRGLLGIPDSLRDSKGGRIWRPVTFDPPNPDPPNVILIIMESFGSTKIGALDNRYPYDLSPCFDSLADEGILFTDFYSTGMHTYTGVFSSLTGCPHQFTELIMKQLPGLAGFYALPQVLRDRGYQTVAFTTHDPHFDNMQGFLVPNGINRLVSSLNYSQDEWLGMWGVPDHVMFDRALVELRKQSRPYFAMILTTSNHGPWLIPDVPMERVPDSAYKAEELNAFRYSDWSLGRFIRGLQSDDAFRNTLVFITADNGSPYSPVNDLDLTQYQEPFLILDSDHRLQPRRIDRLGSQIDIPATVMGLVRLDYDDYTFGHNLLDPNSPGTDYAHFSEWYKIGYVEGDFYLIARLRGEPLTLCRRDNQAVNLADSLPDVAARMATRAKAIFRTGYYNQTLPLMTTDQRADTIAPEID